MSIKEDKPILSFADVQAFHKWLALNHSEHAGIWLRYFKKASNQPGIVHLDAVQEALCWGWIDGQSRTYDEVSWLVKFTPRGRRSIWSQVNIGHVERLMAAGRMQPAGLAVVDAAKSDGRWDAAYASTSNFVMPEDFMALLAKMPEAMAFFQSLNKTNKYSIYFKLHSAKRTATREKRMVNLLGMLQRGEKLH